MFLLGDNSDSPSVVEQLQQGHDSGCYTLLALVPSSMKCLKPYACQLASWSTYYASCSCSYVLMFPVFFSSLLISCFLLFVPLSDFFLFDWGSAAPFIQGVFALNPGIACLTVHPGIACLAFWASDWAGAFWGSFSGFVISHLLLGVPWSVTLVKLIVIGHNCDHLGGYLNCLASTHWLIIICEKLIVYW